MNCPICNHGEHRVLRTDAKDGIVRRARECLSCGKRWHTVEAPEEVYTRAAEIREIFRQGVRAIGEE